MSLMIEQIKVFTEQVRSPYARAGYHYPTRVEGEVRFVHAQVQQITTRCPRIVTVCLLAHSMLIKTYVHV